MRNILCTALNLYVIVIILRMVLSFFPVAPGTPMYKISALLRSATDPLLLPLRRIIPPIGAFDLSPLVLLLGLQIIVGQLILGC
jgi:YggT family protein